MKKCYYFPNWEEKKDMLLSIDGERLYRHIAESDTVEIIADRRLYKIDEMIEDDDKFKSLVGKVIKNIILNEDKTELLLETDFETYKLYNKDNYHGDTYLEYITEDYRDVLINQEILSATVSTNVNKKRNLSETWTFYKLATSKGYVDMRWHAHSNGCYSEEINVNITNQIEDTLIKLCEVTNASYYNFHIILDISSCWVSIFTPAHLKCLNPFEQYYLFLRGKPNKWADVQSYLFL